MYDDTVMAKATESFEEATPLETLYAGTVASYVTPRYFTISPNPSRYKDIFDLMDIWRSNIRKALYSTCHDYVFVVELAGGIRPHYHGVCDVKDNIGFTKKMFKLAQFDNVKIHQPFKQGIGYMFKDVDTTYSHTGVNPVIERQDDTMYYDGKKKERSDNILRRRQSKLDVLNKDIPAWMRE